MSLIAFSILFKKNVTLCFFLLYRTFSVHFQVTFVLGNVCLCGFTRLTFTTVTDLYTHFYTFWVIPVHRLFTYITHHFLILYMFRNLCQFLFPPLYYIHIWTHVQQALREKASCNMHLIFCQ